MPQVKFELGFPLPTFDLPPVDFGLVFRVFIVPEVQGTMPICVHALAWNILLSLPFFIQS